MNQTQQITPKTMKLLKEIKLESKVPYMYIIEQAVMDFHDQFMSEEDVRQKMKEGEELEANRVINKFKGE